jgi:hypothetical protein
MYSNRIVALKERLKYLEQVLESSKDKMSEDALKAIRIDIYDVQLDIRKYSKLQWDEDHERVNFEDDR